MSESPIVLLDRAFPFQLELDADLRVVRIGASLRKLCPTLQPGDVFSEQFHIRRPPVAITFEQLRQMPDAVFVIEWRHQPVRLRGQVVERPESSTLLFLMLPVVTNLDDLRDLGLTLDDFPLHAQTADYLLLQQSATTALNDTRSLASDLEKQRARLARAHQLLGAQYAVTAILAGSASVADAYPKILSVVGETLHWDVGVLWQIREDSQLSCDTVWTGDVHAHRAFLDDSRSRRFARGEGLPGRVLATGEPAWIPDVAEDQNFPRSSQALRSGLRSGFAFPIKDRPTTDNNRPEELERRRSRVVAVMEFFSHTVRPLDQRLLDAMAEIGAKIGQFADQTRSTTALRQTQAQLQSLLTASPTIIYSCRVEKTFQVTFVSDNITNVFGWIPQQFIDAPDFFMAQVHPEDQPVLRAAYDQLLKSGAASYDYRFRSKGGTYHWRHDGLRASLWRGDQVLEAVGASQDVSDLKRVERELRESEERKTAILSSALDCVITADHQGRIVDFNAVAEQTFGYKRADVVGREMAEVVVPERLRDAHRAGMQRFVDTKVGRIIGQRLELPAIRSDGTEFPVELAIAVVEQDGPPLFVGYLRDLTERKRAEAERQQVDEALRESERQYRSVVDSVQEVIFQADTEGRWTFLNPAWTELTGHALEDSVGALCGHWVHADDRVRQQEAFQKLMSRAAEDCRIELRYHTASGDVRWFDVFARLAFDAEGTVTGMSGTLNDVTDRRRAEQALRDSEARTRAIVDTAAEGVITIDDRGAIELFNAAAAAIFGYGPEDVIGRNVSMLMPLGDASAHDGYLGAYLGGGQPRIIGTGRTVEGRRRDGTSFPMHLAISEVQVSGRRMFTGIVRDLTEQTRAERALKEATLAAEAANQAKSDFLAAMSHEIRTPLNAIVGMTDLALQTTLTTEQRDLLKTVQASSDALLQLINDLLDFSKIEAGQFDLELAPFDPRAMFDTLLRQFSVVAQSKRIRFVSQIDPDLPSHLLGDLGRVRQVLTNLLGNALKFTERGRVSMTVAVEPGPTASAVALHVSVADTGIGIPAAKRDRIFEKFFQVDSTIARRFGGTGLGLSISRSLVLQMGGRIWFETEEGEGTTFHVVLPLPVVQAEAGGRQPSPGLVAAPATQNAVGCRILVVEDNPDNQRLARAVLEAAGYRVEMADDGRQGVARALDYRFDLILMDLQMPIMDGLEATAQIRADEARLGRPQVPIVALTAHAIKGLRERCLNAGMNDYVTKPFDKVLLLETLERLIDARPMVLIADDTPEGRMLLSRYLEQTGQFRVLTAKDGDEALALYKSTRISLVTLDMQMPPHGGLAVARAIRALPDADGVALIAVTGLDSRQARRESLDAGCLDHLVKPIARENFLEAVTLALGAGPADRAALPDRPVTAVDSTVTDDGTGPIRVSIDPTLSDLVPTYLDSRRNDVQTLRALAAAGDFDQVRALGHKLKGSGAGYGFEAISRIGRELEHAGAARSTTDIAREVDQLENYLARVEIVPG